MPPKMTFCEDKRPFTCQTMDFVVHQVLLVPLAWLIKHNHPTPTQHHTQASNTCFYCPYPNFHSCAPAWLCSCSFTIGPIRRFVVNQGTKAHANWGASNICLWRMPKPLRSLPSVLETSDNHHDRQLRYCYSSCHLSVRFPSTARSDRQAQSAIAGGVTKG